MTTQQKTFIITGAIALIAVIGAIVYFAMGKNTEPKDAPPLFATNAQNTPVADPSVSADLPEVVARVNNEEIKREELLNTEAQILAGQGVDPSTMTAENWQQLRGQALDIVVSNALVRQAAANSGVQASDEDVNAQMEVLKGQFEDQAKYEEALSQQGMTEADFRKLVASDVFVQTYIEQTLNLRGIDATEEEVVAMYEQQSSAVDDIPPLEEIREQFKAFVIQQKQQQVLVSHIQDLRSKANIEVLL